MKQLKLTVFFYCFLGFFFTESLTLPTKLPDVDNFHVTQKFIDDNVGSLTVIAVAQYVQEATFEEVEVLVKEMLQLRDKCLPDETLPECARLANDVLQESICAVEGLPQKYNFSHCCIRRDLERRSCFLSNKKADVGFLPPFPIGDPEKKCQDYQQKKDLYLKKYIYEVARRNPFLFAPTLLIVAARFEEVANTCCTQQDIARCFQTRAPPVIHYLKENSAYEKIVCGAFMRFGPKTLNSINIAELSQKFPRIAFKELTYLVGEISSQYGGCCEGDVVRCMRGMSKIVNDVCTKQNSISSKLKECCEKTILECAACIIYLDKDEKPKDLSPREAKFTDSKDVCQHQDADQDNFMNEFLYEYSRRHQDLSIPELLRIGENYENLLADCCKTENPPDCYRHAEEKFNKTTEKSLKIVRQECERFQNLGKDDLKYHYFVKLTKMAPQLSTEELTSLSKEIVAALGMCCAKREQFACVDNLVDLLLGEFCGVNRNRTINPAVDQCCKSSFAFRRHCFEGLKADKTYVPPSTSQDLFALHEDLCQAQNGVLQRKKDRYLVNIVKLKPHITEEGLRSFHTDFTNVIEQCCKAEGPEACFKEEHLAPQGVDSRPAAFASLGMLIEMQNLRLFSRVLRQVKAEEMRRHFTKDIKL
ncbi:afamin-like [Orycteropus afer afer]|uniref:Afamin-like n=1 Tax=Orycteropus afer afer TaxID=1230840 RepID=A0A8B7A0W2_ORYAF|nr:afamin-like [Orycteropus afer afer]